MIQNRWLWYPSQAKCPWAEPMEWRAKIPYMVTPAGIIVRLFFEQTNQSLRDMDAYVRKGTLQ